MILRYYIPYTPGLRFRSRVLWLSARTYNDKYYNNLCCVKLSNSSYLLHWFYYSRYKLYRIIDWFLLYQFILYYFVLLYSVYSSVGYARYLVLQKSASFRPLMSSIYTFIYDLRNATMLSNLELVSGSGAQLSRSAGSFCILKDKLATNFYVIKLPSAQLIMISYNCRCILGRSSNIYHMHENYGKAGTNHAFGLTSRTSGLSMNAVDHPHGGRSGPGNSLKSPWGWTTI